MVKEQPDKIFEALVGEIDTIIKPLPRDTTVGYIFTCDYCNHTWCRSRAEVITDILTKHRYASCTRCGREVYKI